MKEVIRLQEFSEWKNAQLMLGNALQPREWYYGEYGRYCQTVRRWNKEVQAEAEEMAAAPTPHSPQPE